MAKKKRRMGEIQHRLLQALDEFCADHEQIKTRSGKIACLIGGKYMVDIAIRKSPALARKRR